MGNLVECNKETCGECRYSAGSNGEGRYEKVYCDYICITNRSRIFKGREMMYDPSMCDKFKPKKKRKHDKQNN